MGVLKNTKIRLPNDSLIMIFFMLLFFNFPFTILLKPINQLISMTVSKTFNIIFNATL